jgi:hypothetical protein
MVVKRMSIDYKELNQEARKDKCPILVIDELLYAKHSKCKFGVGGD